MATIHTTLFGSPDVSSLFADAMENIEHKRKIAVYVETGGDHGKIIFSGSDLVYGSSGELYGGTVTKVTIVYGEDRDRTVIDGLDIAAVDVPLMKPAGFHNDVMDLLFSGDDTIIGSDHSDYLRGGDGRDILIGGKGRDQFSDSAGNDRFTGGKGADAYSFYDGSGHDVITDFDTTGPDGQHDSLLTFTSFEFRKSGHDVIMDYGDSGTVKVLDVTIRDLTDCVYYG